MQFSIIYVLTLPIHLFSCQRIQLLIDRRDEDLDEDEIADYITENFEGNSLIAAGDEDLIKIHFHTNEPWKILEYCNSIGDIYDIVVEDMIRQSAGLHG